MGWWSVAEYKAIKFDWRLPICCIHVEIVPAFISSSLHTTKRDEKSSWLLVQSLWNYKTTTTLWFSFDHGHDSQLFVHLRQVLQIRGSGSIYFRTHLQTACWNMLDIVRYFKCRSTNYCIANCPVQTKDAAMTRILLKSTPKWGKHGQTSAGLQDQLFVLDPISLQYGMVTLVCPHNVSVFSKLRKSFPVIYKFNLSVCWGPIPEDYSLGGSQYHKFDWDDILRQCKLESKQQSGYPKSVDLFTADWYSVAAIFNAVQRPNILRRRPFTSLTSANVFHYAWN